MKYTKLGEHTMKYKIKDLPESLPSKILKWSRKTSAFNDDGMNHRIVNLTLFVLILEVHDITDYKQLKKRAKKFVKKFEFLEYIDRNDYRNWDENMDVKAIDMEDADEDYSGDEDLGNYDYDNDGHNEYGQYNAGYDSNNPWVDVYGEGDDAESAYWNTH